MAGMSEFFKKFSDFQSHQGVDLSRDTCPFLIYQVDLFQNLDQQADALINQKYYKMAYGTLENLQQSITDYTKNIKTGNLSKPLRIPIPSVYVIHTGKEGLNNFQAIYDSIKGMAADTNTSRIVVNLYDHHDTNETIFNARNQIHPEDAVKMRIVEVADTAFDERSGATQALTYAYQITRNRDRITGEHTLANASGWANVKSGGGKWRGGHRGGRGGGRGGYGGRGGRHRSGSMY